MRLPVALAMLVALLAGCSPSVSPGMSSVATGSPTSDAISPRPTLVPTEAALGPHTSPAAACVAVDVLGSAPRLELVTPDGAHHAGAAQIPSTTVEAGAGQGLAIVIAGDACAIDWYIAYGAPPPSGPAPWKFTPIGELVPTVAQNRDPAYASQNRFSLAPLPPGEWLITVELTLTGDLAPVVFRVSVANPA